jgi:hypothetical protein
MQSKQSEKYITLNLNNEAVNMSLDTYTRWLCLLEGVDYVERNMKKFGRRLKNEDIDWIKPLAFQRYITERFESMKFELTEIDKNDEFNKTSNSQICITSQEPALV